MKVICAGFSKTGTKSMTAALRILGYTVYDFDNNFYELVDDWMKICEEGATSEHLRRMYKDVDAVSDIPPAYYWEEIHKAFPESNIILTLKKSEEAWLESWKKQMEVGRSNVVLKCMMTFTRTGRRFSNLIDATGRVIFGSHKGWPWQTFPTQNWQLLKRRYREHTEGVIKRAPKDKLLVFDLGDGWKPLCDFLGEEVPKVPFPYKNKKGDVFDDNMTISPMFKQMIRELYFAFAVMVVLFGLMIYYIISFVVY